MGTKKRRTTKEVGEYKIKINNALLSNPEIMDMLIGDTTGMKQKEKLVAFKEHIMSHLFIDETIKEKSTYIFYDVFIPFFRTTTKKIHVIVYAICHRDILENIPVTDDSYCGNRTDILSQMVEDTLCDETIIKEYGIGDFELVNLDIYNSTTFYGRIMTFDVHNFR